MHVRRNHKGPITQHRNGFNPGNTHMITDNAGDSVLVFVLKRMEEIENENKELKEQTREQQEWLEKILRRPQIAAKKVRC